MDDLRDCKPKWKDIGEFELPEAIGIIDSNDYLNAIREKLINCTNYLAQIIQFMPDIELEILKMENDIHRLTKKRQSIINWHLANPEKIGNMYRRSKDLMIAFIESKIADKSITEIDDSIQKILDNIVLKKHELIELQYRRDLLNKGIDSCIYIINSLKKSKNE